MLKGIKNGGDKTMNNNNDQKKGSGAGAALLVGVAVGAAGMYLKDKKNQKKVSQKLDEIRAWSDKNMKSLTDTAKEKADDVMEMKDDAKAKLEDTMDDIDDEPMPSTKSTKTLN